MQIKVEMRPYLCVIQTFLKNFALEAGAIPVTQKRVAQRKSARHKPKP